MCPIVDVGGESVRTEESPEIENMEDSQGPTGRV